MRKAFAMVELVFVIVIVGILAAVAMPKLVGIQDQAHAVKAVEFVGQLNSIIFPKLYALAAVKKKHDNGDNHAITNLPLADKSIASFKALMEMPKNFVMSANISTTNMGASNGVPAAALFVNTTNHISIWCRDGNETTLPRCWYNADGSTPAVSDFNVSNPSF